MEEALVLRDLKIIDLENEVRFLRNEIEVSKKLLLSISEKYDRGAVNGASLSAMKTFREQFGAAHMAYEGLKDRNGPKIEVLSAKIATLRSMTF